MNREELQTQKGGDVYGNPVSMPDGTVVSLFPADGFDFNPGKAGLASAGLT